MAAFSPEEQAAIEAAVAAGRVQRVPAGEWPPEDRWELIQDPRLRAQCRRQELREEQRRRGLRGSERAGISLRRKAARELRLTSSPSA